MSIFSLERGRAPLLISMPHDGRAIPPRIEARMTDVALRRPDTDWHVARLYAFARELGASLLIPQYSRYVIDLSRPADGTALYPGQAETGLCPLRTFSNQPIYKAGQEPDHDEVAERIPTYWRPYHDTIEAELARLREQHPRVVLWEAHSIRSRVPLFFEGRLPDLNLGTANGASCSEQLQSKLNTSLTAQQDYTYVVNGRFKGGYITRHYGKPDRGIDAVQLELAQSNYMDEDSFEYIESRALPLQRFIRQLLQVCIANSNS